jgi:manganese-dependent inorganic pyrophosphatase
LFFMTVYVVGHKNPDSDSVFSAIAYAYLKNEVSEEEFKPMVAGRIGFEASYVLDKFGISKPDVLKDARGKKVVLVDHNKFFHSVEGIENAEIVGIIDHHALGKIVSRMTKDLLVKVVGSSCTLVKQLYDFYRVEIPKDIAAILLCGVLSDTLVFRSPTTTYEDRDVAEYLAKIVGVEDIENLGFEIIRAGLDFDKLKIGDFVFENCKDYFIGGKKFGIVKLSLVDVDDVSDFRTEIFGELEKLKGDEYDFVFLMLIDITKKGSELFCIGCEKKDISRIFGDSRDGWYEGLMSRKKQVVPKLERYFG